MVFIPDIWGCVPQPERACAIAMAGAAGGMLPYVLVSYIHAIFEAYSPGWADTREAAWAGNWNVHKGEVEIDTEMVGVYFADDAWMLDVYDCRLAGGCLQTDPVCLQINFYGSPVPIT